MDKKNKKNAADIDTDAGLAAYIDNEAGLAAYYATAAGRAAMVEQMKEWVKIPIDEAANPRHFRELDDDITWLKKQISHFAGLPDSITTGAKEKKDTLHLGLARLEHRYAWFRFKTMTREYIETDDMAFLDLVRLSNQIERAQMELARLKDLVDFTELHSYAYPHDFTIRWRQYTLADSKRSFSRLLEAEKELKKSLVLKK